LVDTQSLSLFLLLILLTNVFSFIFCCMYRLVCGAGADRVHHC
jgi:hypothetical protein